MEKLRILDENGMVVQGNLMEMIQDKINELVETYNKLDRQVRGQAYENDPLNRIG